MKKPVLLLVLGLAAACSVRAQVLGPTTLNSAGGTKVIGSNEFDWSVGEMTMVSTFTMSNLIVTQGVLQPAGYSNEGVPTNKLASELQVYPNPATNIVNIDFTTPVQSSLTYRLMDIAGKVIKTSSMDARQGKTSEQVDVASLANATYMLEVTAGSESVSYKIEKRN